MSSVSTMKLSKEILSQLDDAVVQSLQLGPAGIAELKDRVSLDCFAHSLVLTILHGEFRV